MSGLISSPATLARNEQHVLNEALADRDIGIAYGNKRHTQVVTKSFPRLENVPMSEPRTLTVFCNFCHANTFRLRLNGQVRLLFGILGYWHLVAFYEMNGTNREAPAKLCRAKAHLPLFKDSAFGG